MGEFCFKDDMFTVFAPANVAAFWEWIGLLQPGTAALTASSDATKSVVDASDEPDVKANDKAATDYDLALELLNKQLREAMRTQDGKSIRRLMKERNALVAGRSK